MEIADFGAIYTKEVNFMTISALTIQIYKLVKKTLVICN